jgi:Protein of unknown function (DUF3592)
VIVVPLKALAGTVLSVWGVVLLIDAVRKLHWAVQSDRWPTVDAEIVDAEVVWHPGRRGGFYAPRIQYRYLREGVMREGEQLDFGGTWGSGFKRSADRRLKRYSKGARVLARVHPTEPTLSVLQPGTTEGVFLAFLPPAILMTLGLVWLLEGLSYWLW